MNRNRDKSSITLELTDNVNAKICEELLKTMLFALTQEQMQYITDADVSLVMITQEKPYEPENGT